ncbi:MAG: hypothetical protein AB7N80_00480 [Bdellovibrionales bacterium]
MLRDVVIRLDEENIPYFLVGSLGSMYYGRPRFTKDVDLVVQLRPGVVVKFTQIFPIEDYYCPPIEVLTDEVVRRGSFNLIHQQSGIKIDIVLYKDTEYHQSEFSRRAKVEITPQFEVYIAAPENIILKKLDYYREGGAEKHLTDIREILAGAKVDDEYLQLWIEKLGLQAEWGKI